MKKSAKKPKKKIIIETIKDSPIEEVVSKKIVKNEERQLIWFFLIIVVVFFSFLGPYFYIEGLKKFDFGGVQWDIQDKVDFDVYHARFYSLSGEDLIWNVFLRNDPRTNDIPLFGKIKSFKTGGMISFSPEIALCKGEMSRMMLDFGGFLSQGIGIGDLTVATTNYSLSEESDVPYADCSSTKDKTVIMIEKGVEGWISSSNINPNCYIIKVRNCGDILPVEKFMIETISSVYDSP